MTLSQHSAAPICAGFAYQFERSLLWLAKSPAGSIIGIETDDDVTVVLPDTRILEQDKHSLDESAKPFDDRSVGLWKTLAIWIDAIRLGEVNPTSTKFLLVTNRTLDPSSLARKIDNAKSEEEVEACISALLIASENPPVSIKMFVEQVLNVEMKSTLAKLLSRCHAVDGTQSSAGSKLREDTLAQLQIPEWCIPHGDSIANELLGWVEQTAMSAWRDHKPAWIERDKFVNQLHAILDLRKRQITRERAEHLVEIPDESIGQQKGSSFVRQLYLITEDEDLVDSSIREFIRCNIEKSRLSADGNITDEDWKTFENTLCSRWEKIRARVTRMKASESEKDVGFEILMETTESHRERLAGIETEQVYLTSGTYHRLSDMIAVGWHPRFRELMGDSDETI